MDASLILFLKTHPVIVVAKYVDLRYNVDVMRTKKTIFGVILVAVLVVAAVFVLAACAINGGETPGNGGETAKTQITIPTLVQNSFVFDGTTRTVQLTATNPAFSLGGVHSATNAGTYAAVVTLFDTDIFEWSNGTTAPINLAWEITRAIPNYTIPTGLTATFGDTLSTVTLPTGWAWVSPPANVGNVGNQTHQARFTPADTVNFISVVRDVVIEVVAANVAFPQISAGGQHSMALDNDGNVWTWGWNEHGRLGHGDTTIRLVPTKITHEAFANANMIAISAGTFHSMALDDQGNVWTWGDGGHGRLGHGNSSSANVPTKITHTVFANANIIAISAGGWHSMALDDQGNVWTWGSGLDGRLGHNNTTHINVPTMIMHTAFAAANIISISAGSEYSMALDSNGNVWTWGRNWEIQLGHGDTDNRLVPTKITHTAFSAATVIAISAGRDHGMALDSEGNVWTWGIGANGRLGHGDTEDRLVPTKITHTEFTNTNIIAIYAGGGHNMALDDQGNVWTWGAGGSGRLGHGNTENHLVPTAINHTAFSNANIIAIAASLDSHSIALDSDGNVWTWGSGWRGRLGHNDETQRNLPTMITHPEFVDAMKGQAPAGSAAYVNSITIDKKGTVCKTTAY